MYKYMSESNSDDDFGATQVESYTYPHHFHYQYQYQHNQNQNQNQSLHHNQLPYNTYINESDFTYKKVYEHPSSLVVEIPKKFTTFQGYNNQQQQPHQYDHNSITTATQHSPTHTKPKAFGTIGRESVCTDNHYYYQRNNKNERDLKPPPRAELKSIQSPNPTIVKDKKTKTIIKPIIPFDYKAQSQSQVSFLDSIHSTYTNTYNKKQEQGGGCGSGSSQLQKKLVQLPRAELCPPPSISRSTTKKKAVAKLPSKSEHRKSLGIETEAEAASAAYDPSPGPVPARPNKPLKYIFGFDPPVLLLQEKPVGGPRKSSLKNPPDGRSKSKSKPIPPPKMPPIVPTTTSHASMMKNPKQNPVTLNPMSLQSPLAKEGKDNNLISIHTNHHYNNNSNNKNGTPDYKIHKHTISVKNIPSSPDTNTNPTTTNNKNNSQISTISSNYSFNDRVTLTINTSSGASSASSDKLIPPIHSNNRPSEDDVHVINNHQNIYITENQNQNQPKTQIQKNITRCSLGPSQIEIPNNYPTKKLSTMSTDLIHIVNNDSNNDPELSGDYPNPNTNGSPLTNHNHNHSNHPNHHSHHHHHHHHSPNNDSASTSSSNSVTGSTTSSTTKMISTADVFANSISYPGSKANPYCPSCHGVVPLNHLETSPDLPPVKSEHGAFWNQHGTHNNNNFRHTTLHRESSFHSYGGFTLNGQPGHIKAKKHKLRRICASHKVAFVVGTFSLIVIIGLVITLLLMKKKGMMEAM